MVEYNAHGLTGFFQTLKNVSTAAFKFGKEWTVWLFKTMVEYFKWLKNTLVQSFKAYFIRKDLSKEEL